MMPIINDALPDLRRRHDVGRWVACSERKPTAGLDVATKVHRNQKNKWGARCLVHRVWMGETWGWITGPGGIAIPKKHWPTHWFETAVWIEGEKHPFAEANAGPAEKGGGG